MTATRTITVADADRLTQDELAAEAKRRFGDDPKRWAFECPACGDVATVEEFLTANAAVAAGQDCIGRHVEGRGCNWTAYGLLPGPALIVMPNGHEVPSFRLAPAVTK